jgi:hypothetical protein
MITLCNIDSWCQKWDWIGLSESSGLKQNGASNGTPESHARKDGNTGCLASQMNVNGNKLDKFNGSQEEIKAMLEACLEKMETNPGEMKPIAENEEVHDEKAVVEVIGASEDRSRDLAVLHVVRAAVIKD